MPWIIDPYRKPTLFLVSDPYPRVVTEALDAGGLEPSESWGSFFDFLDGAGQLLDTELRLILRYYGDWPTESLDSAGQLLDTELRLILRYYGDWPPEALDCAGQLLDGELRLILISYTNWPPEALDAAGQFIAGTLT